MPTSHDVLSESLINLSKDQIQQAGQRYTPGVDPEAPNLRIEPLFTAIENLACGASALKRFESILDEFSEAWGRAKHCSQRRSEIEALLDDVRASLPKFLNRFRARDVEAQKEWSDRVTNFETVLIADMAHWRAEGAKLQEAEGGSNYSITRNTIYGNVRAIDRCLDIFNAEKEYIKSAAFKVLFDPFLLISGEWGTGKTHLMCDVTQDRIHRDQPTVLVLAKNFQGKVAPEICARIEPEFTPAEVFDRIEDLARYSDERAVIILDGVNEGRRREWRDAISCIQAMISDRHNIGLVVTCRTPFESISIPDELLDQFHKITHFGFDDQEFDAQAAFFQHYNLPLPEVPLLDREFSRPLTLKLICQSLQNLTDKKLAKGFAGIASGQKGMTYVLESFVNGVGQSIEREFGLKAHACWWLLKGSDRIVDKRLSGFAPCMAASLRGYVRPSEADRIIAANYPEFRPARRRQLLEALRTSGLIEEDAIWISTKSGYKPKIIFRLPYQRFSDHLVARHLLKTYLDTSSPAAIKRSFMAPSPLSRIFKISKIYRRKYVEPGWAQALITEFPERVGRRLPSIQRELFFVLPKRSQDLGAYFDPFIEGIFWRDPAAFTEGTRIIVNHYLSGDSRTWDKMIDALAAVSTKPKHPYHARRFYDFIARYPMPERDLQWSEYLRKNYVSPTIHRLLTWAKSLDSTDMTPGSAKALIILLSLVLTTVNRSDRDLATKTLVLLGEKFPEILFTHALDTLKFNDPYVPERMLAAAYGVTLSLVDSDGFETFRPLLGKFANSLYRNMFAVKAKYATHHTLMRDYALGVIQVAQRVKCVGVPKASNKNLVAPFPGASSTFVSDGTPDSAVSEAIGRPIKMDFGNYTIGHLIPKRSNYDDKKPDYVQVRAKIERRIFDLGYRAAQFNELDREIGSTSWNAGDQEKVDRYGKKYSWIAYFEMHGEREALRKLPDWRLDERTSDCGVDPSFPKDPPAWVPPIPDLFGGACTSTQSWVEGGYTPAWRSLLAVPEINGYLGDWVLLEGYVSGADKTWDREMFAFLRGIFVVRRDLVRFKDKFLALEYPGNSAIPEGASEHYLYAGEAGRRQNYAQHLYQRDGRYRRQTAEAFGGYERVCSSKTDCDDSVLANSSADREDEALFSIARFLRSPPKMRHVPGIRVELPSIHFGWESYHSPYNSFSGFTLPAPSLIQRLCLSSKNREVDFYDSEGKPGVLYREAGSGWTGNRHNLLYIRADLLRRYLTDTRQVLVWCNWGERDWLKKLDGDDVLHNPARQRIFQEYSHIHRSFSQWSTKDTEVI